MLFLSPHRACVQVYIQSRNEVQEQALRRVWLLLWVMALPTNFSIVTVAMQNLELQLVAREVKEGMSVHVCTNSYESSAEI